MNDSDFFTTLVTKSPKEAAEYIHLVLKSLPDEERICFLAILVSALQDMYFKTKRLEDALSLDEERLT